MSVRLDRREFISVSGAAGAGLVLAFYLPFGDKLLAADAAPPFAPNAWLRIAPDGTITVQVNKSEMGQGVATALPMLVAEELEADWTKIRFEFAPAAKEYISADFGMQATGGSSSVSSSWEPLRTAGAAARMMLVAAAVKLFRAGPLDCRAENGGVIHSPSGRRIEYGELAQGAARESVPREIPLKHRKDYRVIGTRVRRLDTPAKVRGTANFGIDTRLPGMKYAAVLRCPVFGGKAAKVDDRAAKAVPGVRQVVQIDGGVAVIADHTGAALQGRSLLNVEWDEGANAKQSSAAIREQFAALCKTPGVSVRGAEEEKKGKGKLFGKHEDVAKIAKPIEAVYEVPFLAHAPMEPMSCTARVTADGCEVWAPTQGQTLAQGEAARITGLPPEKVKIHTTFLGGGFGRRFESDFITDAVQCAKAAGVPVKVTWSRADDLQHGFYRPASYHQLGGALDANGMPVLWSHRIASPSIMSRVFPDMVKGKVDPTSVEGAKELPYEIPAVSVDYHLADTGVPVGFLRSVGHSHNGFVTESFLDELAAAGRKDPFVLRRQLLDSAKNSRLKRVLDLAADKAGWNTPLPPGRARGIACHVSFGSYVAEVAEVSVDGYGAWRAHRVVVAIDCGQVVNPDTVAAQMESCVIFGLSALKGAITIRDGRVEQSNFHDYPLLRMPDSPVIETHIVESNEKPSGVGEPGVPPLAPAVCNALFALTGKRIRTLPITAEMLRKS
jgi:isoquinoline 1-oxidoreductase beta subunit